MHAGGGQETIIILQVMALYRVTDTCILYRTSMTLIDINECSEQGICPADSRCINTITSYSCTCDAGYFLMSTVNSNKCSGKNLSFSTY